jgi:hypothetical protein
MLHSLRDDDDDVDGARLYVCICRFEMIAITSNDRSWTLCSQPAYLPACSVDSRISGSSASYDWDLYWSK